jgi:predicted ATPase
MSGIEPPFLRSMMLKPGVRRRAEYPFSIDLLNNDDLRIDFRGPLTMFTGENGTGKSTLLEVIAEHCGFSLAGGNANHLIGQRSDVSELTAAFRFAWTLRLRRGFFLRAESLFNFASYLDDLAKEAGPEAYAAYGGNSLHQQSHGEAFMNVLRNRLPTRGIFILDEPEAALSPTRQLQLLGIFHEALRRRCAQIIISTHSPILLSYPGADILELNAGSIERKPYRDTENFQLYARFMARPEAFHQELFG